MSNEPTINIPPEFAEFFGADELDPELLDYMYEDDDGHTTIKHPLVFSMWHAPLLNRQVNGTLAWKRECLVQYREQHNWHGYINAHERPYRIDALLELAPDVTHVEWWELVAFVWMDSENIREFPDAWEAILRADRPERHAMMDEDDKDAFDALPTVIVVYQGCTNLRDDGWSWTIDRTRAEWFANRFAMFEKARPRVRVGRVDNKDNITAYLTGRNESEVIVAPEFVKEL